MEKGGRFGLEKRASWKRWKGRKEGSLVWVAGNNEWCRIRNVEFKARF